MIATGVLNVTCCQPTAVSAVNVAVASNWPSCDHRCAVCVPLLPAALVEADARDEAVDARPELHAQFDGLGVSAIDLLRRPVSGKQRCRPESRALPW